MISDGNDIYVVKHAYIPEDQLLKARIDRKSLSALGTPVTVDAVSYTHLIHGRKCSRVDWYN